MTDFRENLRRELRGRLGVRTAVTDDTPLFSGGLLDSLNVLELVTLVEHHVGKSIPPEEITLENFDSLEQIDRFVARVRGSGDGR